VAWGQETKLLVEAEGNCHSSAEGIAEEGIVADIVVGEHTVVDLGKTFQAIYSL